MFNHLINMLKNLNKTLMRIIFTFIIFIISFLLKKNSNIQIYLLLFAYFLIAYNIIWEAILNILNKDFFDENFLLVLATSGAFFLNDYREAVAIVLFFSIGEFFQSYAINNSKNSISALINTSLNKISILRNGNISLIKPNRVKIGEVMVIKPGEKILIDGIVIKGSSSINNASLTGESLPLEVENGSIILSGSINLNSIIQIKTTKSFSNSTSSKILNLIEASSRKKTKMENFIRRFARYYTPFILFIAIFITFVPTFYIYTANFIQNNSHNLIVPRGTMEKNIVPRGTISNEIQNTSFNKIEENSNVPRGTFSTWLYRGIIFLVISCPCALVISVPLSFFSGIGLASKKGILIKGGNFLELLSKVKYIFFDKTGTLTKGNFSVKKIVALNNRSSEELLRLTAFAEAYSNHPIALSIKERYGRSINYEKIENLTEFSGFGIEAIINKSATNIAYENKILKYIFKLVNFNNLSSRFLFLPQNALKFQKCLITRHIYILSLLKFLKISRLFCKNSFLWKNSVYNGSNKQIIQVGNKALMKKLNINITDAISEIGTVVYVAIQNQYAGYLVIKDEIRSESVSTIQKLQNLNMKKIIMLTGDKEEIAKDFATQMCINEFYCNLLPIDKVNQIEKIIKEKKDKDKVMFVGDGINDSPVLMRADIGVAMGGIGSDIAIESADMIIMNDDLSKIPLSISIAKKTMRIVYENIVFAISVKFIILLLGAFGFASIWLAIFADVGVSILAILNSIRMLLRFKAD